MRLRRALNGSTARYRWVPSSRLPCRTDVLALLCAIDAAVGSWEPNAKGTVDQLAWRRLAIVRPSRRLAISAPSAPARPSLPVGVGGGVVSVLVLPAPPIVAVTACASVPLSATVSAPIVTTTPAPIAAATTLARAQMPRTVDPFVFILDLVPYVIQANGGEPWSLLPAASAIDLIPRSCGSCPGAVQRNAYRLADDDGHEVPGCCPAAPVRFVRVNVCGLRTSVTVHAESGPLPTLVIFTVYPWLCSCAMVSCTDPPLRWGRYSRRRQCQCCGCYSGCGEGCDGELHHLKPLFMLSDVPAKAECLVRAAKPNLCRSSGKLLRRCNSRRRWQTVWTWLDHGGVVVDRDAAQDSVDTSPGWRNGAILKPWATRQVTRFCSSRTIGSWRRC